MGKPIFDYSKLLGRITERYRTQKAFCSAIGIGEPTLSGRLKCDTYFTMPEIYDMCSVLEIPRNETADYFFTPTV